MLKPSEGRGYGVQEYFPWKHSVDVQRFLGHVGIFILQEFSAVYLQSWGKCWPLWLLLWKPVFLRHKKVM